MAFMKLPAELRGMIYEHLLISKRAIYVVPGNYPFKPPKPPFRERSLDIIRPFVQQQDVNAAILSVSKETHAEASPVLYSKNKFYFQGNANLQSELQGFVTRINTYCSLLRHIILDYELHIFERPSCPCRSIQDFEFLAAVAPGIKTIHLAFLVLNEGAVLMTTTRAECFRAINALSRSSGTVENITFRTHRKLAVWFEQSDNAIPGTPAGDAEMADRFHREMRELGWTVIP